MKFFKNGSWLVLLIIVLCVMGAGLTVWNYTKHVFSSGEATVIANNGTIEALFPKHLVGKILPHQKAHVTFQKGSATASYNAEVLFSQTTQATKDQLVVVLHLDESNKEKPSVFIPGTHCAVTIDATIPSSQIFSEKLR